MTPPCGNHTLLFGRVCVNRSQHLVPYLLDPANPESWLFALAFCLTRLSTCSGPGLFGSPMPWQMHSHHICTTSRIPYMDGQALVKELCLDLVSEAYMPPTCNGGFDIPIRQYARAASKSIERIIQLNPTLKISQDCGAL
jgi:hypothetical protein